SGYLKSKNVTLTGYVTDEEQVALYNLATLYCQASFYEGFGLPVLEAMSCGTPVVASKINVFKEIAGDSVIYADPGDALDMANKLSKVVNDKSLRDTLIEKGLKKAKDFSWEKTAKETIDVYRKVTL